MTDKISPEGRSAIMRAIRSKDTKPEMVVRRIAHNLGYRFRLHYKNLPGKPDIVFPKWRSVIFVHGCFWHQHPDKNCINSRKPKSNSGYWQTKLSRNHARDTQNEAALQLQDWRVLVIWECQTKDRQVLEQKLLSFLKH